SGAATRVRFFPDASELGIRVLLAQRGHRAAVALYAACDERHRVPHRAVAVARQHRGPDRHGSSQTTDLRSAEGLQQVEQQGVASDEDTVPRAALAVHLLDQGLDLHLERRAGEVTTRIPEGRARRLAEIV